MSGSPARLERRAAERAAARQARRRAAPEYVPPPRRRSTARTFAWLIIALVLTVCLAAIFPAAPW